MLFFFFFSVRKTTKFVSTAELRRQNCDTFFPYKSPFSPAPPASRQGLLTPVWVSAGFSPSPCGETRAVPLSRRFTFCCASGRLTRASIHSPSLRQEDVRGIWSQSSTTEPLITPLTSSSSEYSPRQRPRECTRAVWGFQGSSSIPKQHCAVPQHL